MQTPYNLAALLCMLFAYGGGCSATSTPTISMEPQHTQQIYAEKMTVIRARKDRDRAKRRRAVIPIVEPAPTEPIEEPAVQVSPTFSVIYDGYGAVDIQNSTIVLEPKVATQPSETHAALVKSDTTYTGDYTFSATMRTEAQLRTGTAPNPWEVGWIAFGYKPDGTFKYLILKPNGYGIELGEFLGGTTQNFLWTSDFGADDFPIGRDYRVEVRVRGETIEIWIDGARRISYRQTQKDRLSTDGAVAFYAEDARVVFSEMQVWQR